MTRHTYRPIEEAPRDGTPLIGVCGGVECCVVWDDHGGWMPPAWYHWDEDDLAPAMAPARDQPTRWRAMF